MANGPAEAVPIIEGYLDLERIGDGGFSRVYRARQVGMAREVAIKVLQMAPTDDAQLLVFRRECQAMGQLSRHPNIVTVFHDAYSETGSPCIVMELYTTTCREQLRAGGPFTIPHLLDVGVKLAGALQAVHSADILHRDIKPHNVFVSDYGEPALGDFGISSMASDRSATTGTGFSLDYAAPEILNERTDDPRSDVYSLAATLYHLATGLVPYPHEGPRDERVDATIRRILHDAPPTIDRGDAPAGLSELLSRSMAKDPAERPSTAVDFGHSLQIIQSELGLPQTNMLVARAELAVSIPTAVEQITPSDQVPADLADEPGQPDADELPSPRPRTLSGRAAATTLAVVTAIGVAALAILTVLIDYDGDGETPSSVAAERLGDGTVMIDHGGDRQRAIVIERYDTGERRPAERTPAPWGGEIGADETVCFRVAYAGNSLPGSDGYSSLTESACVTPAD